jgi:lipoic acid synthetase
MTSRPKWLRAAAPTAEDAAGTRAVRAVLQRFRLNTVCQGAVCPNAPQCWARRTATFMILGSVCTRSCRFCAVPSGDPASQVDADEPRRIAEAVRELGLRYVVLTSVDRDDLPDGGSAVFAETVRRIRDCVPGVRIEALVPDFSGDYDALDRVAEAGLDVLGHNVETVERLTSQVRDRRAGYRQSLGVLAHVKSSHPQVVVKSGLMLGLGEMDDELLESLGHLRNAGVDILTLGQYLRPDGRCVAVDRYVPPDEFADLARIGRRLGFRAVVAGPLVRSSFDAEAAYEQACAS